MPQRGHFPARGEVWLVDVSPTRWRVTRNTRHCDVDAADDFGASLELTYSDPPAFAFISV